MVPPEVAAKPAAGAASSEGLTEAASTSKMAPSLGSLGLLTSAGSEQRQRT